METRPTGDSDLPKPPQEQPATAPDGHVEVAPANAPDPNQNFGMYQFFRYIDERRRSDKLNPINTFVHDKSR